ncbi:hypothetical protein Sjap_020395 [Stephania japonica]|uniref:Uncharacterized protein n=1 Tax=Stephania japonica TaxID=461633 RepID=A0AAP0I089_9MAGN
MHTRIVRRLDNIVWIPKHKFEFVDEDVLQERVDNHEFLTDIIGCLSSIGDIEPVGSDGSRQKRDIQIMIKEDFT